MTTSTGSCRGGGGISRFTTRPKFREPDPRISDRIEIATNATTATIATMAMFFKVTSRRRRLRSKVGTTVFPIVIKGLSKELPVRVESGSPGRPREFLIFKAEMKRKRSWHFAHIADRLVRVRHESSETTSGMGQKGDESLLATVRVH